MAAPPGRPSFLQGGKRLWPALLRRNKNRRQRAARGPAASLRPQASAPGPRDAISRAAPASTAAPGERRRRLWSVLLPLLAMVLGSGALGGGLFALHRFVTRSPHFALRTIRTTGLVHLSPGAVTARTGVALGDNLFSFSLEQVARRLKADPWIASVRLHRELPSSLAVEIEERSPVVVAELGSLYLTDARGEAFKRATLDEAASFPVVTGIARDAYIHDREGAQALLRDGIAALGAWRSRGAGGIERPPIGEIHVDAAAGTTLYTREGGVAIKLGRADERTLGERLRRVDAVRAELSRTGERARVIHADAPLHPERITVRLAAPPTPTPAPPSASPAPAAPSVPPPPRLAPAAAR